MPSWMTLSRSRKAAGMRLACQAVGLTSRSEASKARSCPALRARVRQASPSAAGNSGSKPESAPVAP